MMPLSSLLIRLAEVRGSQVPLDDDGMRGRVGHLTYAGSTEYQIDDRALAHLKAVVGAKLRRQECFFVSWTVEPGAGSGRVSLWFAPGVPLEFRFSGSRSPQLNGVWLEVMAEMANTARGLVLVSEAEAEAIHRGERSPTDEH